MYGQNFKKFPQDVWTAAGISPKSLNLFGSSIRPQKTQNLFGQDHQFPIFVLTSLKNGSQQWANVRWETALPGMRTEEVFSWETRTWKAYILYLKCGIPGRPNSIYETRNCLHVTTGHDKFRGQISYSARPLAQLQVHRSPIIVPILMLCDQCQASLLSRPHKKPYNLPE